MEHHAADVADYAAGDQRFDKERHCEPEQRNVLRYPQPNILVEARNIHEAEEEADPDRVPRRFFFDDHYQGVVLVFGLHLFAQTFLEHEVKDDSTGGVGDN